MESDTVTSQSKYQVHPESLPNAVQSAFESAEPSGKHTSADEVPRHEFEKEEDTGNDLYDSDEERRIAYQQQARIGSIVSLYHSQREMVTTFGERTMVRVHAFKYCLRIFNILYALGLTAVFSWYMYTVVRGYQDDQSNPATAITIADSIPLAYPMISFCQVYHLERAPPLPLSCRIYRGAGVSEPCTLTYRNFSDPSDATFVDANTTLPMQCLVLNNDTANPLNITAPGVHHALRVFLEASDLVSLTYAPIGADYDTEYIFRSGVFGQPGTAIVSLKQTTRTINGVSHLEWDTTLSNLYNSNVTAEVDPSLVSDPAQIMQLYIMYSTYAVTYVKQQSSVTIAMVIGNSAGMIGILLGLNAVNLIFGLEAIVLRCCFR
eukprot:TRINITY_DN11328_c0_g1_i1.p1 TRINITY_DN11328_c0_g1~~TRINITY_DN11328_c0_g1_i1.p1  ORF type:complete len:394 (-),score=57.03 TRINITY_DN11328_c0_g1_i1:93-1226(-)